MSLFLYLPDNFWEGREARRELIGYVKTSLPNHLVTWKTTYFIVDKENFAWICKTNLPNLSLTDKFLVMIQQKLKLTLVNVLWNDEFGSCKRQSSEISGVLWKNRPEVFCKKFVFRNFAKFTGKYLCQSLFLMKLQTSSTGAFLWILQNFLKQIFYRTPLDDWFCLVAIPDLFALQTVFFSTCFLLLSISLGTQFFEISPYGHKLCFSGTSSVIEYVPLCGYQFTWNFT